MSRHAAGRDMIAAGDALRDSGGRLVAYDAQARQTLAEILASSRSDDAIGIKGVALPMTGRSDERYVAHVLPLTSGVRRRAGVNYSAVAAVFVRKATLDTRSPLVRNFRTAGLCGRDVAMLDYARKVAREAHRITQEDIDGLRGRGFSDAQIADIAMCAALRCFVARYFEAVGAGPEAKFVDDDPAARATLTVGRPLAAARPAEAPMPQASL